MRGFSLVELMVTVAIIAVLSGVGFTLYSSVQSKARDSQRKADLSQIQSALEQYKSDQHYYPLASAVTGLNPIKDPAGTRTYLSSVPQDPSTSADYIYAPEPSGCNNSSNYCLKYSLTATIENPAGPYKVNSP